MGPESNGNDGSEFRIPQGGLVESVQQDQEHGATVEDNSDINSVLIETFGTLQDRLTTLEPFPDESAKDYQRRIITTVINTGKEKTSQFPPKPSPSSEQFK